MRITTLPRLFAAGLLIAAVGAPVWAQPGRGNQPAQRDRNAETERERREIEQREQAERERREQADREAIEGRRPAQPGRPEAGTPAREVRPAQDRTVEGRPAQEIRPPQAAAARQRPLLAPPDLSAEIGDLYAIATDLVESGQPEYGERLRKVAARIELMLAEAEPEPADEGEEPEGRFAVRGSNQLAPVLAPFQGQYRRIDTQWRQLEQRKAVLAAQDNEQARRWLENLKPREEQLLAQRAEFLRDVRARAPEIVSRLGSMQATAGDEGSRRQLALARQLFANPPADDNVLFTELGKLLAQANAGWHATPPAWVPPRTGP